MVSILTRYFNLTRILLLVVGLWPYQRSKLVRFQMILLFIILTSSIVFQLATFITAELSVNLVINVLSCVLCFTIFVVIYGAFSINTQTVKCLLEQIQYSYHELKDDNEFSIIEEYECKTKRFTNKITVVLVCTIFPFLTEPFWPRILGAFLSINQSRSSHKMFILTEYFVDVEKYFYLNTLHTDAALCIGMITMVATGTTFIGYVNYACGMFKIASYRIEQAMTIGMLENIKLKNNVMIYKNIMCAVDIHRKAMKLSGSLVSNFQGCFFFLIVIGVACLSLSLYGITSLKSDMAEFLPHFIRIPAILVYMFVANYFGQEVIDHNNHIFFAAYNIKWYKAPLDVQKLILILLQRGNKTFGLTVGGLLVASSECFASMISASISYFTVIYSVQQ